MCNKKQHKHKTALLLYSQPAEVESRGHTLPPVCCEEQVRPQEGGGAAGAEHLLCGVYVDVGCLVGIHACVVYGGSLSPVNLSHMYVPMSASVWFCARKPTVSLPPTSSSRPPDPRYCILPQSSSPAGRRSVVFR